MDLDSFLDYQQVLQNGLGSFLYLPNLVTAHYKDLLYNTKTLREHVLSSVH